MKPTWPHGRFTQEVKFRLFIVNTLCAEIRGRLIHVDDRVKPEFSALTLLVATVTSQLEYTYEKQALLNISSSGSQHYCHSAWI